VTIRCSCWSLPQFWTCCLRPSGCRYPEQQMLHDIINTTFHCKCYTSSAHGWDNALYAYGEMGNEWDKCLPIQPLL
jgi:hypothetical protein